jgi:hypothetical protein
MLQPLFWSTAQNFYEKREGSGSVLVTKGSGCGSGKPKNIGNLTDPDPKHCLYIRFIILRAWIILVHRYYCRAGLFGSKCDLSMQLSPLDCSLVSALSITIGEWHNSLADFNPNHNHGNADPKQASLQTTVRPQHHATPKQNTVCTMYSSQYQSVK